MPSTRILCGKPLSKTGSRPTEAWWSSQVCCSKAEIVQEEGEASEWERYYRFSTKGGDPMLVRNTLYELRGPPEHLLGKDAHRNITAFIELRQPYWNLQPDWSPTYHSFLLLEVDEGAFYLLCERKTDLLELVIGDIGIPLGCMKALRAYGSGRDPGLCTEQQRVVLPSTITVHDFFSWLDGPLEESWGPYDLFSTNCQHFTRELRDFLLDPLVTLNRAAPLEKAAVALQGDPGYVLSEVKRDWHALKFAREVFRRDPAIVYAAVERDGRALRYAHERLRRNRNLVLAAVANTGSVLPYLEGFLRQDREVVQMAVRQEGLMLRYAAEQHRADPALALAAVRQDGYALRYATGEAQWDPEVLLAALVRSPFSALRAGCC